MLILKVSQIVPFVDVQVYGRMVTIL